MRKKTLIIFSFFLFSIAISGCRSPIDNPESLDPIYSDLENRAKQAEMAAASEQKAIDALIEEIPKTPPRDPMKKQQIREKYAREKKLVQLKQDAEYFKIRAEQRKAFAKREYLKAFNKEQPWPNPAEFEAYKATNELRNAPRGWEHRVPKLTRHNKVVNAESSAEKAPSGEASAEKPAPAGQ